VPILRPPPPSIQAVFSYWNLLAFTTAPLEQISLAFIPAAAPGWRRRETVAFVLRLGALVGVAAGLLSAVLPLAAPQLLTRDAAVWPHMAAVAPLALGAMLLTAADVASTGALLAVRCAPAVGALSFAVCVPSCDCLSYACEV
jgi:peptidoglycan/LPS O-acetylase OafA/YrhL